MAYKFESFLVTQKMLINIKSFELSLPLIFFIFLYRARYMIRFFMVIYIELLIFYIELTYLAQKF